MLSGRELKRDLVDGKDARMHPSMSGCAVLPNSVEPKVKPFLKWAGGKFRIVDRVREALWDALPARRRLIEPFAGSGAVFLNTSYDHYIVGDSNADLINVFEHVRAGGGGFVDYTRSLFVPANNKQDVYYQLREEFNGTVDQQRRAALFVYLNRHCFNGLCRYNSKGAFNVPFGRYSKPYFPEAEMVAFTRHSGVAVFRLADFLKTMDSAEQGDVVYCDPPYVPLSKTSNFTDYTHEGFGPREQQLLADKAAELAGKGIPVVISNHETPGTVQTYSEAGADIRTFDVQRFISCDASTRGKAKELLAVFS